MEGPHGITFKNSYDQCHFCHWYMEGAPVKRPGETGIPMWCGAGADDYFMTGRTCASRLPRIEITFYIEDDLGHPLINDDQEDFGFKPEVAAWIKQMIPQTEVEHHSSDYGDEMFTIKFDCEKSFLLFKTFWL